VKILQFDSVGGASGDMILGVLINLGANSKALREQLASLGTERFEIEEKPHSEHGLNGIQVTVRIPDAACRSCRHLRDIRKLVENSALSVPVKTMSIAVFERLAEAEAKVHGISPDNVHFHEVGSTDSIIDIVGSCAAMDMLKVHEVAVGPLPLGHGTAQSSHGMIPVPAPATVELLKGHPVEQTGQPFELVTPTGAALLSTWKTMVYPAGSSVMVKTANAFGHRKLNDRPNLLRAFILETVAQHHPWTDECLVLQCNLDDTIPELLGSLAQRLIENGALDVFSAPVHMKKQRPGTLFTVLCRPTDKESFLDIIFSECTTFGIREHKMQRTILKRRHVVVQTPYGEVRVKIGSWKGKEITRSPEHDDCVRCAESHGVPVRMVYEASLRTG